jgi:hypothetical protein
MYCMRVPQPHPQPTPPPRTHTPAVAAAYLQADVGKLAPLAAAVHITDLQQKHTQRRRLLQEYHHSQIRQKPKGINYSTQITLMSRAGECVPRTG